ncbi:MAG: glycosyltransferase family 2 protein [Clostridium sp.]|jgi:glycosyltransferase involved in cell wall biosynthesis|nr:glycosyltransferase family 2 protein [Clostridium sp.]
MEHNAQKDLLIIIPAYNEERNLPKICEQLETPQIAQIADILFINDASDDDTSWVVKARGYALVTHPFNLGYGSALQLGYKYAVRRDYRYVIQLDADGQHDIGNVLRIYDKLLEKDAQGHSPDLVLGSRFLKGSAAFPVPFQKKAAYALFRFLLRLTCGKKIADPTTGLQGLSRRAYLYYSRYRHFDDRYPDANAILEMELLGFRVVEIPAVMYARDSGVSMHSGLRPVLYMFRLVFSIFAVVFRIKVLKMDAEAARKYETVKKC